MKIQLRRTVCMRATAFVMTLVASPAFAQQAIYQSPSLTPDAALKAARAALETFCALHPGW